MTYTEVDHKVHKVTPEGRLNLQFGFIVPSNTLQKVCCYKVADYLSIWNYIFSGKLDNIKSISQFNFIHFFFFFATWKNFFTNDWIAITFTLLMTYTEVDHKVHKVTPEGTLNLQFGFIMPSNTSQKVRGYKVAEYLWNDVFSVTLDQAIKSISQFNF